jgi:hypothetical protein
MLELFGGVELLLADGEDEVQPTVAAGQSLVSESHSEALPKNLMCQFREVFSREPRAVLESLGISLAPV